MNQFINCWVTRNYYYLKNKCLNIHTSEFDDIYHDVLVQLLNKDEDFLIHLIITGNISRYVIAMFKLNVYSETAPYRWRNKKYKTVDITSLNLIEDEQLDTFIHDIRLDDLSEGLEELDIFFIDKIIFNHYINNKVEDNKYTFDKLSEETGISKSNLRYAYDKVRDIIRKKYNKEYE